MHAVISNSLEDSINKLIDKGTDRNRLKEYNYSGLDVFFENEKKMTSTNNEAKFHKALSIDAYRDVDKVTKVYMNWKKGKILQQSELRERLELEKEAANLLTNIMFVNPPKSLLKDLYHMCTEMMNRYNPIEKRETFKIIMNFTNMNRKSVSNPGNSAFDHENMITTTARIKKNVSFSSSKSAVENNTISVHHSLQRESKLSDSDANTEGLLDYPTAVSAQSSNKIKHKKSLPVDSQSSSAVGVNASNGFLLNQNSAVKPEKIEQIYGMRNNKAKRGVSNQKSSSMKVTDNGIDQGRGKISFEDYLRHSKQKEVSLPYIQSSQSANAQANSLVNPKDIKWSPSKRRDKKIVAEHNLISANMIAGKNSKAKKSKLDVSKISGLGKNSHKFVAIYANSNS